jgi:DNA end-binding protein Ku
MVKGYELKKDEYVVVEDEELKKMAPPTATTMDVLQFAAEDEVDPVRAFLLPCRGRKGQEAIRLVSTAPQRNQALRGR